MPMTLDENLDPALYPLAWLIGTWRGTGAVQLPAADGSDAPAAGRAIEQEVTAAPREDGTLGWTMRTWMLDAPAPVPPTAAFGDDAEAEDADEEAQGDAQGDDAQSDAVEPERSLLVEETGVWAVLEPVPGQDLEAAAAAKPGSPASLVSYQLQARISTDQDAQVTTAVYAGEVRGPRIRLVSDGRDAEETPAEGAGQIRTSRLFGLVGGRLFWVIERASETTPLAPWISAELDRA